MNTKILKICQSENINTSDKELLKTELNETMAMRNLVYRKKELMPDDIRILHILNNDISIIENALKLS
jgi:hypothetical protein